MNATLAVMTMIQQLPAKARGELVEALAPKTKPVRKLLRHTETAERLGVTRRTLSHWVHRGILHPVKMPGNARALGFRESEVDALIGA